jgi:hypothetical protein
LINGTLLKNFTPEYIDPSTDPDLKFCQSLRDAVRRGSILLFFFGEMVDLFRDILFI